MTWAFLNTDSIRKIVNRWVLQPFFIPPIQMHLVGFLAEAEEGFRMVRIRRIVALGGRLAEIGLVGIIGRAGLTERPETRVIRDTGPARNAREQAPRNWEPRFASRRAVARETDSNFATGLLSDTVKRKTTTMAILRRPLRRPLVKHAPSNETKSAAPVQ